MRYVSVNVAKIPAGKLDDVSAKIKRMCERSPLMPTYDPNIEYVSISKTHFAYALLLHTLALRGRLVQA